MAKLGQAWMVWGPRNDVKRRCKVEGRSGWYKCEKCNQLREKLEIDHIRPVIKPEDGFTDWNTYITSKFVSSDLLQGLCHDCHQEKSKAENRIRREKRKLQ